MVAIMVVIEYFHDDDLVVVVDTNKRKMAPNLYVRKGMVEAVSILPVLRNGELMLI